MPRLELHKPLDALYKKRTEIERQMTSINDEYKVLGEKLQTLRSDQHNYRVGKENLSNTNMNKAARKVFDDEIASHQKQIEETLKKLDDVEKRRVVWDSQAKSIAKSIKELQNA